MMEKFAFISAVLLLTAPALAIVNITCTNESACTVAVRYDATSEDPNPVRAFALDITLDNAATIMDVNDNVNDDYYIYPGSIVVTDGVITNYGTARADPNVFGDTLGLEPNSMTIEMGSLYYPPDPGHPNAPPTSGILFTFTVSTNCFVSIAENAARGGIVMEDGSSPATNLPCPSCCRVVCVPLCLEYTHPDYSAWEAFGMPPCWCYRRQCRGDADGLQTGPFWVAIPDLNALRVAINKNDATLLTIPNGICCDFDQTKTGPFPVAIPDLNYCRPCFNKSDLTMPPWCICRDFDHTRNGPFRVGIPDLNIMRQYINKSVLQVPVCPSHFINFWTD